MCPIHLEKINRIWVLTPAFFFKMPFLLKTRCLGFLATDFIFFLITLSEYQCVLDVGWIKKR